jgi:hypothetical protein
MFRVSNKLDLNQETRFTILMTLVLLFDELLLVSLTFAGKARDGVQKHLMISS